MDSSIVGKCCRVSAAISHTEWEPVGVPALVEAQFSLHSLLIWASTDTEPILGDQIWQPLSLYSAVLCLLGSALSKPEPQQQICPHANTPISLPPLPPVALSCCPPSVVQCLFAATFTGSPKVRVSQGSHELRHGEWSELQVQSLLPPQKDVLIRGHALAGLTAPDLPTTLSLRLKSQELLPSQ